MTDRELMQQALDAMLNFPNDISDEMFESIRSLRARLAQPEQEIESDRDHVEDDGCPTEKAVLQRFWREHQKQEPVAWTERELELIDGMIEVQIFHAERCDLINNRAMAEKQKGWDMERVELLKKIRDTAPPQREWQYRRGDRLLCLETEEYCVIHVAGTNRQWIKFPDLHVGAYTNEQVAEMFELLPKERE